MRNKQVTRSDLKNELEAQLEGVVREKTFHETFSKYLSTASGAGTIGKLFSDFRSLKRKVLALETRIKDLEDDQNGSDASLHSDDDTDAKPSQPSLKKNKKKKNTQVESLD